MYRDQDVRRTFASVAASQTDSEIWPAAAGQRIRVLAVQAIATSATALTFNSKAAGATGAAITADYTSAAGIPTVDLAPNDAGWFQTRPGESLTVTTGSGATTKLILTLALLSGADAIYDELLVEQLAEDGLPLLVETA